MSALTTRLVPRSAMLRGASPRAYVFIGTAFFIVTLAGTYLRA